MSKIISIGTATPACQHHQPDILQFMQKVFALDTAEKRKLKFLYHQSGIDTRWSVIPDYSCETADWQFYPATEAIEPFPSLEKRMEWYRMHAASLSEKAIEDCLPASAFSTITHLITVSCTGMSAPGLDIELIERLKLSPGIFRTSVNFMGCYAAIHALKIADALCKADTDAKVLIVCTELCTLHFQKTPTTDAMASSLLFSDGAAAVLVTGESNPAPGFCMHDFYSEVNTKGRDAMSWSLSSSGFLMTLSGYVPDLIEADFSGLVERALAKTNCKKEKIAHWCIHPGGKRILDAICKSLSLPREQLASSYGILRRYGNMSSPTILFVLKELMQKKTGTLFGAAFGPGLTMETFTGSFSN